jgi:hypothetical protein
MKWPFGRKSERLESAPAANQAEEHPTSPPTKASDGAPTEQEFAMEPCPSLEAPRVRVATNRQERLAEIRDYLAEEGFRPCLDENGDVVFRFEGYVYLVECQEDDPAYVRVVLPAIYRIGEGEDERVREIANAVANTIKAVKPIVGAQVSFVIEGFYSAPQHVCDVLVRCCSALKAAMVEFDRLIAQ